MQLGALVAGAAREPSLGGQPLRVSYGEVLPGWFLQVATKAVPNPARAALQPERVEMRRHRGWRLTAPARARADGNRSAGACADKNSSRARRLMV